ncbi:hypothetical protein EDC01DRAFT_516874 [Geopyxis carbonaria]|nr:hypothetical protein EDC01DRAFT_516874 [Geopyxis carbonaria]
MHPPVSSCSRRVRLPYAVESESSSPPTLRLRGRVRLPYAVESESSSPPTLRLRGRVRLPYAVESESSSPPTLRLRGQSAYAVSTLFVGQGLSALYSYSRCTRRCQVAPVDPPTLSALNSSARGCLRRRGRVLESAYAVQVATVESAYAVRGCQRGRVLESAYAVQVATVESESAYAVSTQFVGEAESSSPPTRRCQLAPVESAYAVSTQFVAEAKSSSPPTLSYSICRSGVAYSSKDASISRLCQDAPVGRVLESAYVVIHIASGCHT